ncbi:hypothetical protein VTI28DRAFT_7146 [Corynascus sepedonium]
MGKPRRDKQRSHSNTATARGVFAKRGTGTGKPSNVPDADAGATNNVPISGANRSTNTTFNTTTTTTTTTTTNNNNNNNNNNSSSSSSNSNNSSINSSTTTPWNMEVVDDMSLNMFADLYCLNGSYDSQHLPYEQSQSGLSASFPNLDLIDWASLPDHANIGHENVPFSAPSSSFQEDTSSTPSVESPDVRSHSPMGTPATHPAATPHLQCHEADGWQPSTTASTQEGARIPHDCTQEAYEILKTLSSLDGDPQSGNPNPPSCGLDHVLRINRKAGEHLERLLTCSCTRSPHLSLLYVSIISRILNWYQQAANWTGGEALTGSSPRPSSPCSSLWGGGSCNSTRGGWLLRTATNATCTSSYSDKETTASSSPGVVSSCASTRGGPCSNTSVINASSGSGPDPGPTSAGSMTVVAARVKVAVGTFDVDDLGIQNAVKMQLLWGELRRTGRLIDQLAAHYSAASDAGSGAEDSSTAASRLLSYGGPAMYMGTHTSNLHHSLDAWLRGEHARITNMMRLRLKELNT